MEYIKEQNKKMREVIRSYVEQVDNKEDKVSYEFIMKNYSNFKEILDG